MYSWLVGRALRATVAKMNAGDDEAVMRLFATDGKLVFPGRSSFGGESVGREAVGAWIRRVQELGFKFQIQDVTVAGPPWNLRIGVRFTDTIPLPDGSGFYENEGMEY